MNSFENKEMTRLRKGLYLLSMIIAFLLGGLITALAQEDLTQTIRGSVMDADNKLPLTGATIVILDSEPLIGTSTDIDGNFKLTHVPVGRVSLGVSFMGFESKVLPNIIVYSGRETVLDIGLTESVLEMKEAIVKAYKGSGQPTNEMALISTRSISAEEISRMTASFNDPAFITANFAGVRNSGTGGNDIIIRGNSPKYMQWRLEGVPITNPNHFADQSYAVGSTSVLNANLLATSDFYTGAFPAEYGNVISGVYDIKLRNGNNEKREAILGLGLIGTDLTLEGPIKQGSGSSYLVNYRNSTSSVLTDLNLIEVEGDPRFQDAAFKVTLPTKGAGIFSAFGVGGYSSFSLKDVTPFDWDSPGNSGMRENVSEDFDKSSYLINTGFKHFIALPHSSYLNSSISFSGEGIGEDVYQRLDSAVVRTQSFDSQMRRSSFRFSTEYSQKIDARNTFQLGSILALYTENFDQSMKPTPEEEFVTALNFNEKVSNLRNYISFKHRFNGKLSFTAGLHNNNVFFNDSYTLEPRLAARWKFNAKNAFNVGYGLHSTMENLHHYFANIEQPNGNYFRPNKNLKLMKAHHFIAGIDHYFQPNLLAKVEIYYQQLYDVPVENDPNSTFSTINDGSDMHYAALTNQGTARNYGIELSLQKFFSDSYYFLLNTSIYQSKYTALDDVERNTRFNGNYVVNAIFGKEFTDMGPRNNRTLSYNAKIFAGGGQKVIPLLRDEQGHVDVDPAADQYRDYDKAYLNDLEDLYMITISASYKIERSKTSHEIFLNLENITNNKGKLTEYYDEGSPDLVGHTTQFGLLPNLMYRIYL